jgi:hypothetical protein
MVLFLFIVYGNEYFKVMPFPLSKNLSSVGPFLVVDYSFGFAAIELTVVKSNDLR